MLLLFWNGYLWWSYVLLMVRTQWKHCRSFSMACATNFLILTLISFVIIRPVFSTLIRQYILIIAFKCSIWATNSWSSTLTSAFVYDCTLSSILIFSQSYGSNNRMGSHFYRRFPMKLIGNTLAKRFWSIHGSKAMPKASTPDSISNGWIVCSDDLLLLDLHNFLLRCKLLHCIAMCF